MKKIVFGSHNKLLRWLNRYLLKVTMTAIIIITLTNSIFAQTNTNPEIQANSILPSLLSPIDEVPLLLIEEGPLDPSITNRKTSYLGDEAIIADDLSANPAATGIDFDSESLYATTEGGSAIIAPTITDTTATGFYKRDKIEAYTVQTGDTISTIAALYNLNSNTILWENNLTWTSTIRPGQQLSILPTDGLTHTIKSGDTISKIAKQYQANQDEIVTFNKLASAADIQTGEVVTIPNGVKPTAVAIAPRQPQPVTSIIKNIFDKPEFDTGSKFLWPLNSNRITQYFYWRHSGLDVGDQNGNPIFAAESGKVEHAGWNNGYGYNIVVNHGDAIKTLYAHASSLLVNTGDTVSRGQTIARIGSTGRSTGPHLHFEVIIGGRKVNPLNYLR